MKVLVGQIVLVVAASALAVLVVCLVCVKARTTLDTLRRRLSGGRLVVFFVLALCALVWGRKGGISFPRTDPNQSYLTNRGSRVDGDGVYIDFTRIIVPDSASLFVDCRSVESDSDADWVNVLATTFGETTPPIEIPFSNATNYDWVIYTTWTPEPSVKTNGVWHALWGRDKRQHFYYIPLRTAVRVDGQTIATPKSKEDANDDENP